MKKIFALALLALFAFSCQVQEEVVNNQDTEVEIVGVPMQLTASLGTKATYALEGGLLKPTWDANETISLVTWTKSSTIVVDNFTYSGEAGKTSVTFTGTFTGGAPEERWDVYAVYPALTETIAGKLGSAANAEGLRAIYKDGLVLSSDFMNALKMSSDIKQDANGDFSHIAEGSILIGAADVAGSAFTTTLEQQLSVLKVTFSLPAAFDPNALDQITYASIETTNSSDVSINKFWNGGTFYSGFSAGSLGSELKVNFDYYMLDSREFVVYFPFRANAFSAGDKFVFKVHNSTEGEDYTATKPLTSDFTFLPGKQYNMSVSLASTASPAPPAATNLSPSNQTANCYVIASDDAATYKFKNCKGTDYNWLNSTAASAVVLWESPAGALSAPSVGDLITSATLYDDGYVYIETTGARGNAVVAVKDDSDNILWSWHIWCTGASFDPTTDYYSNNMMKVNLGGFSYAYTTGDSNGVGSTETAGLLYQFGRKDPFRGVKNLYADVDPIQIYTTNAGNWNYVASTVENGTVAYAHAHPMTFINPNLNNYDWVYAAGYELGAKDRWSSSNDDPCPYGWHVMGDYTYVANSSFTDYVLNTDKNAGVTFDLDPVTAYFPYAGYIEENNIPTQIYDYRSYGSDYFRYAGFYWCTNGGSTTYRKYMRIEDRTGYDDTSGMVAVHDFGAPTVTVMQTYNLDQMYYFAPTVGCATAMSVRCVKQ